MLIWIVYSRTVVLIIIYTIIIGVIIVIVASTTASVTSAATSTSSSLVLTRSGDYHKVAIEAVSIVRLILNISFLRACIVRQYLRFFNNFGIVRHVGCVSLISFSSFSFPNWPIICAVIGRNQ